MRIRLLALAALAGVLVLGLAACGGGGDSEEESAGERPAVACDGTAISDTGLPASFPGVSGVTFTATTESGPSQVVDGYYEGELQDAYDGYKNAFETAGYSILFDEIEDHDSEVSYEGDGRTGQVALRENCEEDGRISVHVTSRPE
jgi:ABC-type glycerol-3-phosphate transport system substrate-binding protein